MFYKTFIELYNDKTKYDNFIITYDKTSDNISNISKYFIHHFQKPQRLLFDCDDYYIAVDMYLNLYYICFKHLLMLDIDLYKTNDNNVLDKIKQFCEINKDYLFDVYKSRNGYHCFLISHISNYKDLNNIQLMLDLNTDFYYTIYTYLRGWCVRLNKKKNENENSIYKFVERIGYGKELSKQIEYVKKHLELLKQFENLKCN